VFFNKYVHELFTTDKVIKLEAHSILRMFLLQRSKLSPRNITYGSRGSSGSIVTCLRSGKQMNQDSTRCTVY